MDLLTANDFIDRFIDEEGDLMSGGLYYLLDIFDQQEIEPEAMDEIFKLLSGCSIIDNFAGSRSRPIGSVYLCWKGPGRKNPAIATATLDFTYILDKTSYKNYTVSIPPSKIGFIKEMKGCFTKTPHNKSTISSKDIYEANKTRTKCIACGKTTEERQLFTSSVRYCSCVEKL